MKPAIVWGALAAAATAFAVAAAHAETSSPAAASTSCRDAVYTAPAHAPPTPADAVTVGAAVFDSLAHLRAPRDLSKPTKALPFYIVKSPLTILARSRRGATIRIVGGAGNAALVYSRRWLQRLAAWRYRFGDVPRSVRLPLCRDGENRPLNTQYAGGFLLRRPACVSIEVETLGDSRRRRVTVALGVARC